MVRRRTWKILPLFFATLMTLAQAWSEDSMTTGLQINGPSVYGARPLHPFLYRIPVIGRRPLRYSADTLPRGLTLDATTGVITGAATAPGTTEVLLTVKNQEGVAEKKFRIVIGDQLALTPPMGWSSWDLLQSYGGDRDIRRQAQALVSSGLIDHGYSFVNLDDGWNVQMVGGAPNPRPRDVAGSLLPNARYPNMKSLTEYLHSKGLKAGIYTSPGPLTCGRFAGSSGHEQQDARQFAAWGFDLLKYDLCSYKPTDGSLAAQQEPYRKMGAILHDLDRDVLFSLCQYGHADVWTWGRNVGGQMWRTTDDVGWGPKGVYSVWDNIVADLTPREDSKYAGPGGWTYLDDLFLGQVAYVMSDEKPPNARIDRVLPTPLTPDEQYTQMSLWSLFASPLIFGGDMTALDSFTLSLLTNDEVIAIDQDSLGRHAVRVGTQGNLSIWEKELEDGSKAIGIFNLGDREEDATVLWSQLGLNGTYTVRELWRHREMGRMDNSLKARVTPHGVVLVKMSKAGSS